MTFGEIELEILTIIKKEAPKSISELSKIIHKDMSTIQHKVKKMEQEGLIELKKGNKNSKILLLIMIK
jgi:predicted transcriptional regulator